MWPAGHGLDTPGIGQRLNSYVSIYRGKCGTSTHMRLIDMNAKTFYSLGKFKQGKVVISTCLSAKL